MRASALVGIVLCAIPGAGAQEISAGQAPPRDTTPSLIEVRARETAEEVTHTVRPGDTLWGIASRYLNSPFRWPEVFRRNSDVVENPHRIYPGEVIRIQVAAVRAEALDEARAEGLVVSTVRTAPARPVPPRERETVFAGGAGRSTIFPVLSVGEASDTPTLRPGEVDAAPFVTSRRGPAAAGRIVGSADREGVRVDPRGYRFQLKDDAYVSLPPRTAAVGDQFLSLAEGAELLDTARVMVPTGVFQVTRIGPAGQVKARLMRQMGEVLIAQRLIPLTRDGSAGSETLVTVSEGTVARVAYVHGDPVLPSLQHYVVLTAPRAGLRVGDRLTLVDQTTRGTADRTTPPEDAALLQVVKVTPLAATAIVIAQRLPTITVGMRARVTARLRTAN